MKEFEKNPAHGGAPQLSVRAPTKSDGQKFYKMARDAGGLDVNSEYAYLLLGAHFSETCAIAEQNREPLGFISAYILPDRPNVLFVWQVAILPEHRKRGLAKMMLKDILSRDSCHSVRYVQASVTPSNVASGNLFASLARDLGSEVRSLPFFDEGDFSEKHEKEDLVCIGPFFKTA